MSKYVLMSLVPILFGACNLTDDASSNSSNWEVGYASEIVTPENPVWLGGYGREIQSTGVHDDLYAKAFAINNGNETVLIIAADLVGLLIDHVNDIRNELVLEGIPFDNIIINSTHSHSAPDTLGIWNVNPTKSGIDFNYLADVKSKIVTAGKAALESMVPADLYIAKTTAEGITKNLRIEDYKDDEVVVLQAKDSAGQTIATLVNFASHPEVMDSKSTVITADFCYYLNRDIEEEFGGGSMFVNNALGGMVTANVTENTFEETERIGSLLAEKVIEAMKNAELIKSDKLVSVRKELDMELDNEGFKYLSEIGVFDRDFSSGMVHTEVGYIEIGPLLIATIPGELLPKLGFDIKDAMNSKYKMIFCLSNDELGYLLPTEYLDEDIYEYEWRMSISPVAGKVITDSVIEMILNRA